MVAHFPHRFEKVAHFPHSLGVNKEILFSQLLKLFCCIQAYVLTPLQILYHILLISSLQSRDQTKSSFPLESVDGGSSGSSSIIIIIIIIIIITTTTTTLSTVYRKSKVWNFPGRPGKGYTKLKPLWWGLRICVCILPELRRKNFLMGLIFSPFFRKVSTFRFRNQSF